MSAEDKCVKKGEAQNITCVAPLSEDGSEPLVTWFRVGQPANILIEVNNTKFLLLIISIES